MSRLTIHRDTISAGQPRPYADSVYETVFTFEGSGPMIPGHRFLPSLELVKKWARVLGHDWKDEPEWHEPRLDFIHEEQPGVWRVRVVQPYLD